MFDAPSLKNQFVLERYLMSVSSETVFNWFADTAKKAEDERHSILRSVFDEKLVLQLLTRKEPLIDLAVATYCDQHGPLEILWQSGDKAIRAAIAHNTVRSGFTGLSTGNDDLCTDNDLMAEIFTNPSMSHGGLANFLERAEGFEKIPVEQWLLGVHYALRNPILREVPEEDEFSDDGFDQYTKGRPFTAAWRLLIVLPNDDRVASMLTDAFLNVAVFSPPYEELTQEKKPEGESLAQFSEWHERGMYTYVHHALVKWAEPTGRKLEGDDERYGTNRGFIRMGIAAGAASQSHYKNLIAYVRDNPDKWTRAGYYHSFPFRDEASVRTAYERDKSFFLEQAVYNKALYLNTPAGRLFRAMVGRPSGREWEDFSHDQTRRFVFDAWARRLWKKNPTLYPHPYDDLDALNPVAMKHESDETLSEFMYRRADEVRAQNNACLSQIETWLKEAPNEPHRVYPLIVRMVQSVHRDVQECMIMLAETQQGQRPAPKGFSLFR